MLSENETPTKPSTESSKYQIFDGATVFLKWKSELGFDATNEWVCGRIERTIPGGRKRSSPNTRRQWSVIGLLDGDTVFQILDEDNHVDNFERNFGGAEGKGRRSQRFPWRFASAGEIQKAKKGATSQCRFRMLERVHEPNRHGARKSDKATKARNKEKLVPTQVTSDQDGKLSMFESPPTSIGSGWTTPKTVRSKQSSQRVLTTPEQRQTDMHSKPANALMLGRTSAGKRKRAKSGWVAELRRRNESTEANQCPRSDNRKRHGILATTLHVESDEDEENRREHERRRRAGLRVTWAGLDGDHDEGDQASQQSDTEPDEFQVASRSRVEQHERTNEHNYPYSAVPQTVWGRMDDGAGWEGSAQAEEVRVVEYVASGHETPAGLALELSGRGGADQQVVGWHGPRYQRVSPHAPLQLGQVLCLAICTLPDDEPRTPPPDLDLSEELAAAASPEALCFTAAADIEPGDGDVDCIALAEPSMDETAADQEERQHSSLDDHEGGDTAAVDGMENIQEQDLVCLPEPRECAESAATVETEVEAPQAVEGEEDDSPVPTPDTLCSADADEQLHCKGGHDKVGSEEDPLANDGWPLLFQSQVHGVHEDVWIDSLRM